MVAADDALEVNGEKIAPWVGIAGYDIGSSCAEWLCDYMEQNNLVEDETCGVLIMTMSTVSSCVPRTDGEYDVLISRFPAFTDNGNGRLFYADYDGTTEKGNTASAAIITGNPQITKWMVMGANEEGVIGEEEMRAKIGPCTKIVSAVHVSNVLGVANDVKLMAQIAHEFDAVMVVDGAQSAPHFPIDLNDLGCDFFAFSAHKVYGPFGIGVLWGRHDLLDAMPPFLTGGEMIDAVTEQTATWAPVPEKFEAGTQDAASIYALDAAFTYVEEVGFDAIQAREAALVAQCMRRLSQLEFVRLIGPSDPAAHHGVVSFNVCTIHPHDVASILDMDGVAIRAGHHCAQPLLAHLGIDSCCRASFAFYNDARDIDRLIDGLNHVWTMFHG